MGEKCPGSKKNDNGTHPNKKNTISPMRKKGPVVHVKPIPGKKERKER